MEDLRFSVDRALCLGCGSCVRDCPLHVLRLDTVPVVQDGHRCIACQHCLAICPDGALSIFDKVPQNSEKLGKSFPSAKSMECLIKGRRSVRSYLPDNVPRSLIKSLLQGIDYAPTAENRRELVFSLIADRERQRSFLARLMKTFAAFLETSQLPENLRFMGRFLELYRRQGVDILFRGAPHLIIASAPENALAPKTDCVIALSYFELLAPTLGLGSVWCELGRVMIEKILPELKKDLGIPPGYAVNGIIAFGYPAVAYCRTVQREKSQVVIYPAAAPGTSREGDPTSG